MGSPHRITRSRASRPGSLASTALPSIGGSRAKHYNADDEEEDNAYTPIEVDSRITTGWPYQERLDAINTVKGLTMNRIDSNNNWLKDAIANLEKIFAIDQMNGEFPVDDIAKALIKRVQHLANNPAGTRWRSEIVNLCEDLCSHIQPPHPAMVQGSWPRDEEGDPDQLNLVNVYIGDIVDQVKKELSKNTGFTNIEMGYTGMTRELLNKLLPTLQKQTQLTYLGLRGNTLDRSVVNQFTKLLQKKSNFPKLLWIDFQSNKNIVALPDGFLEQLRSRWSSFGMKPPMREVADGRIVVHEGEVHLNI